MSNKAYEPSALSSNEKNKIDLFFLYNKSIILLTLT